MFNTAARKTARNKAQAIATANRILDQGTAIIAAAGTQAYKSANPYIRQFRRSYPDLQDNAKALVQSAAHVAQDAVKTAGHQLTEFSHVALPYAVTAEKKAIRLGFLYLAYKLFVADDERVYEVTHKVKTCIKERPVQSAIVALGAGLLLGKIWR